MKVFNPDMLSEIIELEDSGEEGLLDSLIQDYLQTCPGLLQLIETSAVNKDYGTLERAVHSLKSSSSLIGLELMAEKAFQIENEARDKSVQVEQISELKKRFETGRHELETFRSSRNLKG